MKTTIIKNISVGTSTNGEGLILFNFLDNLLIESEEKLTLSLLNIDFFSSSFLNSSFGLLIDKYGETYLKSRLTFTDYRPSVLKVVVDYVNDYRFVLVSA